MKEFTTKDVVLKLIGNINPAGDASRDGERFENLKEMCDLANSLIKEIEYVALRNTSAYEASVIKARDYAFNFLYDEIGIDYDVNQLGEKLIS